MTSRRNESKQASQDLFTEELINKVCSDFANKMDAKIDKMDAKIDKKLEKLYDKLNDFTKSLNTLEENVSNNQKAISSVVNTCDSIQQLAKNNSLRIHGLPEERDNETVLSNVIEFIKKELHVHCSENDIDSVFRIGQINNKGRTVLVNFVRYLKRCEVLSAKRNLKHKGISIFEDLTKSNYALLLEAKKKFGNKKAWSASGKIFIWNEKNNCKCAITCASDLHLY